ncbi:hypothetical protein [Glacieibacterium frigidum]|uniref:Lipoprotein n=1 Tax=Glacieibacterium frigidum TaxID=2593303 RepID=A0A552UHJ2_9SPHN|nr:hypothetical protein [Glacieibacterium frigidum]TRW17686.1 hypothetical protein FMM06_05960 [Glacieibacterium frigidum]
MAATPAEQVRDRVLAEARAISPAALAYDRTITVTQAGGSEKATQTRVDRWDGKAWTLVSVDGKPPSPGDVTKYRKAASAANVPGYHRLTTLAGAAATTDTQGRTVLRLATLPKASVITSGKDVSEHFIAEAVVAGGPRPYVQQLRLTARAPFRMMLVAKVESFVTVSDYRLDGNTPRLVRQVADIRGSMMGKDGTQRVETIFTYR